MEEKYFQISFRRKPLWIGVYIGNLIIETIRPEKDQLAGYRETIIIPTIQISDNLWWDKIKRDRLDLINPDKNYKRVYFFVRWLRYRTGLGITW